MRNRDRLAGYSDNGDGSITWHVNHDRRSAPHLMPPPTSSRPQHTSRQIDLRRQEVSQTQSRPLGIARVLLIVGLPLVVGLIVNSLLTDGATQNSALATSGWASIGGWVAFVVAFVVAVSLAQIRRPQGRRRDR